MNSELWIIHLLHIFLIGGFLLYVGLKENACPAWIYPTLLVVGLAVFAAHAYYIYKSGGKNVNSWFHVLFVAPLLLLVGYSKKSASHDLYRLVLISAFASITYHSYAIVRYA